MQRKIINLALIVGLALAMAYCSKYGLSVPRNLAKEIENELAKHGVDVETHGASLWCSFTKRSDPDGMRPLLVLRDIKGVTCWEVRELISALTGTRCELTRDSSAAWRDVGGRVDIEIPSEGLFRLEIQASASRYYGMSLKTIGGKAEVIDVVPGSLADVALIRRGHRIIAIDESNISLATDCISSLHFGTRYPREFFFLTIEDSRSIVWHTILDLKSGSPNNGCSPMAFDSQAWKSQSECTEPYPTRWRMLPSLLSRYSQSDRRERVSNRFWESLIRV
ncbi:MAG: hypothetical protein JNJ88_08440 [Planctomycetes bacterium]|nr:hypothetical protein [Planctomycetota bacterium]